MSAFGPYQTSATAPHMSAFGGKADIKIATYGKGPHVKSTKPTTRTLARLTRSMVLTRDVMATSPSAS